MATMKWDINGKGVDPKAAGGGFTEYKGPLLPKGSYVVRLKRAVIAPIKSQGANLGKPRINMLYEVVGGAATGGKPAENPADFPYYGHPIWDGLNIIDNGVRFVNAWLHALGDGSEQSKRAAEKAFWDMDKKVQKVKIEKGDRAGQIDTHLVSFGAFKIGSPNGEMLINVVTKIGKNIRSGENEAQIADYLPYTGPGKAASTDDEEDDDLLDDADDDELDTPDDDEEADESDVEDDDLDDDSSDEDAAPRKRAPF